MTNSNLTDSKSLYFRIYKNFLSIILFASLLLFIPGKSIVYGGTAKYVILLVADGGGKNQIDRARI